MVTQPTFIETDIQPDPGRTFLRHLPDLDENARRMIAEEAISYRAIRVGAAGLAMKPPTFDLGFFSAGNIKPNANKTTKCAEPLMTEKARKAGFTLIPGLVVASPIGTEEIESIIGARPKTLPPCEPCVNFFGDNPLIREDTVVVTVSTTHNTHQVHLYSDLRDAYLARDLSRLETAPVRQGFDDLSERIDMYDYLLKAEMGLPADQQRPVGKLVQMALQAA